VKRIHEYKRQLMNALHVASLYLDYRQKPPTNAVPRTFIFSGKAAPSYWMAKLIIRLINAIASAVNQDRAAKGLIKVAFIPNYGVSLAELLIPAANLSEQISTAGTEASGTGNMKLSLNGALTIGTLDGANIEIMEATGPENFFKFGMTDDQIEALRRKGYDPRQVYQGNDKLRAVLDAISGNLFCPKEPGLFQPIVDGLLKGGDPYFVLADFQDYARCQRDVSAVYRDRAKWSRRSILTVAGMGRFSSDVTISQYAREIWGIEPVPRPSGGPVAAASAAADKPRRRATASASEGPESGARADAALKTPRKPRAKGTGASE
jgi:starch phosphorylase